MQHPPPHNPHYIAPPSYESNHQSIASAPPFQHQHQHHQSASHSHAIYSSMHHAQPVIKMPVLDATYCTTQRTQLILREQVSVSGDDFSAIDQHGRLWFRMDSRAFSMRERRQLRDVYGRIVCTLTRQMLSLSGKWSLFHGNDSHGSMPMLTIEPKLFTLKPKIKVYLNDGDRYPDYLARGDFLGRHFEINRVFPDGSEQLVACCSKQSMFSNGGAFFNTCVLDKQTYYLDIMPGVDAAFIVALCVIVDEQFYDNRN